MSGGLISEEYAVFTVPDPAIIGPHVDKIDVREGAFEVLGVTSVFNAATINATSVNAVNAVYTNATITNLSTTNLSVLSLGTNSITPTPAGSGVLIDGVLIRDRAHYTVSNRSVACFEGVNPASTSGVSISLVPYSTGAIIGAFPDGTTIGGNTRGDHAIDLQLLRITPDRVAAAYCSSIVGGNSNAISFGSNQSSITGGYGNSIASGIGWNAINCNINGGAGNEINAISHNIESVVISGGSQNQINDATHSTIAGSLASTITGSALSLIGGGGYHNINGFGGICCLIIGGANSDILGNSNSASMVGSENCTISGSSQSVIIGGMQNVMDNSQYTIMSGIDNSAFTVSKCTMFGSNNTVYPGSDNCVLIGHGCSTVGTYNLAMGYYAQSTGSEMCNTYCATGSLSPVNNNSRSHKFIDDIFEVHCALREIHNINTVYHYAYAVSFGPQNPLYFKYIEVAPYSYHTIFFHITGGGGNDFKTALGYGWFRCYWRPAGAFGTPVFNHSWSEDSGFGFSFDVVYSGNFAIIRIYCGAVIAGMRCEWTACITDQTAGWG